MNTNWRNRPTTIDYLSKKIDYIVSIDESGNSNLKLALEAKSLGHDLADSEKHFTVTACCIAMKDFLVAKDMVMTLKNKYWQDAVFPYKGINKRVCLHSREIRGKREAFSPEFIDYDSFITDLSHVITEMPMTVFASHIDKIRHVNQYAFPNSPYDLCMNFVLERVIRSIGMGKTCVVILEARGTKEDKALLNQIKYLLTHGNQYNPAKMFSSIKGVYFNPKWCHMAQDQMSYWELELADLCAYPIQKYFVYGKKDRAFEALLPKIYGFPNVTGKGLKSFP